MGMYTFLAHSVYIVNNNPAHSKHNFYMLRSSERRGSVLEAVFLWEDERLRNVGLLWFWENSLLFAGELQTGKKNLELDKHLRVNFTTIQLVMKQSNEYEEGKLLIV